MLLRTPGVGCSFYSPKGTLSDSQALHFYETNPSKTVILMLKQTQLFKVFQEISAALLPFFSK